MKIGHLKVHTVRLPTRREHNWASKMQAPIGYHALVELVTDDGVVGWGEAPAGATWGGAAMRYYGETPDTVRHIVLDHLRPALFGCDPSEIGLVHQAMDRAVKGHPYAKAAVDAACYDATGKALGVPVTTLLGGRLRAGLEVAHSLGIMDLQRCLDEAEQAVGEGVRTVKAKTGLDPERDVALVRGLRERLGDHITIRVDANEGYRTVHEAVMTTRRQEEFGLALCEQPVAGAEALARVAERVETPIMADESAWTVQDILELHRLRAAELFSCYVTKPGGLFRARQQAEVAAALGLYCDIGGSIETGIGNAANLALGVSLPNAALASVCPVSKPAGGTGPDVAGVYYSDDLVTEPFRFVDGMVLAPEGPGLGIEVDREKLERYSA
jgi:muconate cycloisomerase